MNTEHARQPAGAPPGPWLSIIGLGEEGVEALSPAARTLVETAVLVVGGTRHLTLAAPLIRGEALPWASPLSDTLPRILARRGDPVVVLASGDPFFFGVGSTLLRHLPAREMCCLPHPSSVSLAAARLGWAQQACAVVSLTGRPLETLRPALQPGARLFVLTADQDSPGQICQALTHWGFGETAVTLMEALGGPGERQRQVRAQDFDLQDIQPLNLLALEVAAAPDAAIIPLAPGLPDDWFEHDGQITKREIRAITLSSLRPRAGALLWDVGAGSGSIGIEWLLTHPGNRAIAVDSHPERAARAARNAAALGVPRLEVRVGRAPAVLAGLPRPDAIFIGGGARDEAVIHQCWAALGPGGRLVVNGVVLETEQVIQRAWQRYGGTLTRLSVERLEPVGSLHGFRPAMPVMQWAVDKRN
ncbi:precorrin-6Y C5,15-methyltransferase (decarboxylating) [Ectothiorhodospira magna]|uniref:Precorrin-6Y C5,15-methyltransferase (Decarboxylating) n=1 Tax=Ectothiorhodospira magna TaxID=867345 RepID=A0A1H9DQT0_9GAMM|nr:precorrin-6y C5,15-methyltransferase (decarboxylating) subunit CbiE [Ectothiorhodospira magna]SEQ15886.1 precorrin-6Y C5,15-methyltransferase (decarboxylating) [Ectothiorhodospira magna]